MPQQRGLVDFELYTRYELKRRRNVTTALSEPKGGDARNASPGLEKVSRFNIYRDGTTPVVFFFFFFLILRRMGQNKAQAPTLPIIRCTSCFDLTHAPVATAARAAATGLVSMS